MTPVRYKLHRSSYSNGTVPNATKHESRDQWAGSGALVAKKVRRDIVGRTCALTTQIGPICTEVHAVMEWSGRPQNISLGSHGVDLVSFVAKYSDATTLHELVH
jgi:hypothetical protein